MKFTGMLSAIVGGLLFLGTTAIAQEEKAPKGEGKQMTMTGCLTKGTSDIPQHYTFVDLKSGRKYTVTGTMNMEKHADNHTVRITGMQTAKVFNVTKLEHVSETCDPKGGSGNPGQDR